MKKYYLLDTNIVSELSKKNPDENVLRRMKQKRDYCAVSAVSWYENLYGVEILAEGKRKRDLDNFAHNFIQANYDIIPYDEHAASIHSRISAELRKSGLSKPYADLQIAATAIANNMILVTHNTEDFEGIPLLMVEDWFEDGGYELCN